MICPKCGVVLKDNATYENQMNQYYQRKSARDSLASIRKYRVIGVIGNLLTVLLTTVVVIGVLKLLRNGESFLSESGVNSFSTIVKIISIGLGIVGILYLIALAHLRTVNDSFEWAFRCSIASIIVAVFSGLNDDSIILELGSIIVNLISLYFFCKGCRELCGEEGANVVRRWNVFWKIILVGSIVSAIVVAVLGIELFAVKNGNYSNLLDAIEKLLLYAEYALLIGGVLDCVSLFLVILGINDTIDVLDNLPEPTAEGSARSFANYDNL